MANVQFDVDDTSPTILYSPFPDTFSTPNLAAGWNPYFNVSGFNSFPGQVGVGTSMHITSLDGAFLSIRWQGTGIQILGNVTNASFSIELDGTIIDPEPVGNTLVSITNLPNSNHLLSLTAQIKNSSDPPQSMLVFQTAILTTPVPDNVNSSSFSLQSLNDSDVNFLGQWSSQIDQSNQNLSFHQSSTPGDKARSTFLGTTFLIRGRTSPQAGNYSVQLDGVLNQFSAKSSFSQNNTLLFYADGLDPATQHNWEITNKDGSSLVIPFGGFMSFSDGNPNPPPTPTTTGITATSTVSESSYAKGTIAALALAGILAFTLLSGFTFFFLYYRPRQRRLRQERRDREKNRKAQEAGFVLDIGPDGQSRSYVPPDSRRTSRRTGFDRWKHEVEGGALGLSDIGLSFRRSEEKDDVEDLDEEEQPRSAKSFRFTPSPKQKGKSGWMGSMKGHRKGNSSPSFTLDLPPMQFQARSRSGSRSGGASSVLTSLSYISSGASNNGAPLANFSSPPLASPSNRPRDHDIRSTLESDYGSVRDYDDGTTFLGLATAQAAIRSLSPRTSEVGSRSGSRSDIGSPRFVLVPPQQSQQRSDWRLPPAAKPNNPPEETVFLDVQPSTPTFPDSPSQGNNNTENGTRSRRLSSLSHVRFEGVESSEVSEKKKSQDELKVPQKSSFRLTPPTPSTTTRKAVTSFLDLGAGSSDNSIAGNDGTGSSAASFGNQPKSRWSSTTVQSTVNQELVPKPESSDSQSQSQSFVSIVNSSPSFPFPVSLPASPHHPEGHRPSPPPISHPLPEHSAGDLTSQPRPTANLESPTESVPISISDLHFRHSDSEDSDPSSASHLPRHPPLPSVESAPTDEEDIATPTFVVARVIGMATPQPATFTHTRLDSSVSPITRIPDNSQSRPERPPDP